MPIITPQTGGIPMAGGNEVRSIDTYSPPAIDRSDSGLTDLAQSISQLGGKFNQLADYKSNKAEAEDQRNVPYYANILGELKEGVPYAVQAGQMLPELSSTVQARVLEYKGGQQAERDAMHAQEEFNSNLQLSGDRAASEAWIAERKAQAIAFAKGHADPSFGSGYLKNYETALDKLFEGSVSYRTRVMEQEQIRGFEKDAIEAVQGAKNGEHVSYATPDVKTVPNLISAARRGGKPAESIANLSAPFASKLEQMMADAPPEVRSGLKVISGYRSVQRQSELFQNAVKKYGSEAAARKWVARPGGSMHNHGEAVDLAGESTDIKGFNNSLAGKWVHANAEKYGLYFPMGHEPWHIEMRGGRREGFKREPDSMNQYRTAPHGQAPDENDGPDDGGDAVSSFTAKVLSPSGPEGFGNNPNSSAEGPGQYVAAKWLEVAKKFAPNETAGKSDDQILAMRTDPRYTAVIGNVTEKVAKQYAEGITKAGGDVNETNLYIMHHAGENGGAKIIKASDQAKMTDFLSPDTLKANKLDPGLTVGEYKEWAAKKVGGPMTTSQVQANAIRGVDREWAQTGGINGIVRREAGLKAIFEYAAKTGDASILKGIPPEWQTPSVRADMARIEKSAEDAQYTTWLHQREVESKLREDHERAVLDKVTERVATNGELSQADIYAVSRDQNGEFDAKLYDKVVEAVRSEKAIDPAVSKRNSTMLENAMVDAAVTGNYRKLGFEEGYTPSSAEIEQRLSQRSDMKKEDRDALVAKVGKIMQTNEALENTTIKDGYDKGLKLGIDAYMKTFEGGFNEKFPDGPPVNIYGDTRDAYNSSVARQIQAFQAQNVDWRGKTNEIVKNARADAKEAFEFILAHNGQSPTPSTPSTPGEPKAEPAAAATTEAKAAPVTSLQRKVHPDGTIEFIPVVAAAQEPPAATTPPAAPQDTNDRLGPGAPQVTPVEDTNDRLGSGIPDLPVVNDVSSTNDTVTPSQNRGSTIGQDFKDIAKSVPVQAAAHVAKEFISSIAKHDIEDVKGMAKLLMEKPKPNSSQGMHVNPRTGIAATKNNEPQVTTEIKDGRIIIHTPPVTPEMVQRTIGEAAERDRLKGDGSKPSVDAISTWFRAAKTFVQNAADGTARTAEEATRAAMVQNFLENDPTYRELVDKYNNAGTTIDWGGIHSDKAELALHIKEYEQEFAKKLIEQLNTATKE